MASEEAVVLSWDAREFHVICPFCGGEEDGRFRSTDRYSLNIYKRSEYHSRCRKGYYYCIFPFNEKEGITWYEIDKVRERYVNIRFERLADVELRRTSDAIDKLAVELESTTIADSHDQEKSWKKSEMTTQQERISVLPRAASPVVDTFKQSEILLGKLQKIRSLDQCDFEEDIADREIELDECLRFAMCHGTIDDIKLVLQSGADIHHISGDNSRTPLMEATFWGELEMVELLLKNGEGVSRQVQIRSCLEQCLVDAASLGTLEVVQRLLEEMVHDQGIQSTTSRRRTALMEACLWGRMDVVQLLLKHGESTKAVEENFHQAVDFARPKQGNRLERHKRTLGVDSISVHLQLYQEDVIGKDETRKAIVRLFEDCPPTESQFVDCSFMYDSENYTITLEEKGKETIFELPCYKKRKTVAELRRGPQFQSIASMSGWGHDKSLLGWAGGRYLNPVKAISEVFGYARLIGHTIERYDKYDAGIPGQHYASHAEKQLIVEYLNRHAFLPHEEYSRQLEYLNTGQRILEQMMSLCKSALLLPPSSSTVPGESCATILRATITTLSNKPGIIWYDVLNKIQTDVDEIGKEIVLLVDKIDVIVNLPQYYLASCESQLRAAQKEISHISRLKPLADVYPPANLQNPAILVSSSMCGDCEGFWIKTNDYFHRDICVFA